MITLPVKTDWNICTPAVFRYMDQEYVDQFFEDGSIRLSSFKTFHRHADEQRLDRQEGKTMFVHCTKEQGGQTITAWANHAMDAYVLCTTMRYNAELMKSFNSNSYLRINNPTAFGMALARHIPCLRACFEGPCLYQDKKIIQQDLGYIDTNRFATEEDLKAFIISKMAHYPLFLKEKEFSHQVEYRLLWIVDSKENEVLDIKVPEARKFCEKPNELTD